MATANAFSTAEVLKRVSLVANSHGGTLEFRKLCESVEQAVNDAGWEFLYEVT